MDDSKILERDFMNTVEYWRKKIQEERYEWVNKEPNAVRLMMSVQRGAVLLGKDHIAILDKYKQPKN